jgi:hypothetical protein
MGVLSFDFQQRMALPFDILRRGTAGFTIVKYFPVVAEGSSVEDKVTLV